MVSFAIPCSSRDGRIQIKQTYLKLQIFEDLKQLTFKCNQKKQTQQSEFSLTISTNLSQSLSTEAKY